MKKLKNFLIALTIVLCIGINAVYLYILQFGENKVISKTYEVDLIELADGRTQNFIEINLYDNCYELKFNCLLDENRTSFVSQGVQYFGNINFNNYTLITENSDNYDVGSQYTIREDTFTGLYGYKTKITNLKYNSMDKTDYLVSEDFYTATPATNPITINSFFKITIDGEIYGMKFKGFNPKDDTENCKFLEKRLFSKGNKFLFYYEKYYYYYQAIDVDYLAEILYESVSKLKNGTSQTMIFSFADLFDYYEYKEDGTYANEPIQETSKIEADIKSYYSIKVTKHEGDIQKASDSLFGYVNGSPNYNISGGTDSDSYFINRQIINLTEKDFNPIKTLNGGIKLQIKEDCLFYYEKYKNILNFTITIDDTYLNSLGNVFIGIDKNSLKDLNIIKTTSSSGEEVKYV